MCLEPPAFMSKLVLLLIKWIVQRLSVLVLILAVLLAGVWIKSEWSKLSRTMEEIRQKERFMGSLEGELDRLNAEIEKEVGPQREKLAKLDSLDKVAAEAWNASERAKFRWDYWRGEVGWYQALLEQWSLHAWLTLQLRYLAFHGPCKLVLKGCRGVRAEEPDPDKPRMINQASTIGFSANLEYKNTRCETFISYLRGKEDLFNDLFAGGPGRFVYEEMPAGGRKTGITGRGLEGLVDASLKLFGI